MNTPTDPLEAEIDEAFDLIRTNHLNGLEDRTKAMQAILSLIHTREQQARVDELNLMDFRVEQASSGVGLLRFEDSIIRPYVEKRLATLNKEETNE